MNGNDNARENTLETVNLQLVDQKRQTYKWYKITFEPNYKDLFSKCRVIIERGRIGQAGEKIERTFHDITEGDKYFRMKIKEKMSKGYVAHDGVATVVEGSCALCDLLTRADQDACYVCEFRKTVFFLNWDQTYLGRSMLVFKQHISDFFSLAPSELLEMLGEIRRAERALRVAFSPDLMNYLFMGNRAGHVHLHLVPRYRDDPRYGQSPFLDTSRAVEPQLAEQEYAELARIVRAALEGGRAAS